jgi:GlpG protein
VPHSFSSPAEAVQTVPVTIGLIVLSLAGFLLFYLHAPFNWLSLLTYSDFQLVGGKLVFIDSTGQYWRWLTPIFLHFGWLHITFNSLWMWELGGQVEQRLGSPSLVALVLICGIGSNIAQGWYGGPSLFGGMSGVVYGLLGFCWIYSLMFPLGGLQIPRGIVIFMLVWLVFGMVGSTEALGFGSIANAAHLAGLVLGCLCGFIAGEIDRQHTG